MQVLIPSFFNRPSITSFEMDDAVNRNIFLLLSWLSFSKVSIISNPLKSDITIFDVDNLTDNQLTTITRHEFGHALGLAHSTAFEDLMAQTVITEYPYISECDVDAIILLYDGGKSSQVVCET